MKLVYKNIEKDGKGSITLMPEEQEDIWHAYNLISEGDIVRASTIRKVQNESSTGSSTSSRVRTTLTISVETIDFDTQGCMLRLKGRNVEENQYVKGSDWPQKSHTISPNSLIRMENPYLRNETRFERYQQLDNHVQLGNQEIDVVITSTTDMRTTKKRISMGAYHTLDLEVNRKFSLSKEEWDSISLERVEMACDITQNADMAAVVMQDGFAQICLITNNMTIVRTKIDVTIPRKRKGNVKQHEKGLTKFYDSVMQGILRHINFDVVKCIIVASPGFVRDQFCSYMFQEAVKTDNRVLLENKSKFLLVHSSSGFKHSLKEVLTDPAVVSKVTNTKAMAEVKALETFYQMLQTEPSKAFYGFRHVLKANESQAIETLLISDKLFRIQDVAKRKQYVSLVDSVRESGGDVKIFSSLHISGEQLDQLTGIAAILRFPLPDLEDEDDEDGDSDGDGG